MSEEEVSSTITPFAHELPDHVSRHWIIRSPMSHAITLTLSHPDSETAVVEQAKINPKELEDLTALRQQERIYEQEFSSSGENPQEFFSRAYAQLFNETSTETTLQKSLALTLTAMKHESDTTDGFEPWDTQRVALLRMLPVLCDQTGEGAIINLRTGMGKSAVLLRALIPPMLLVKKHVDVISTTPLSRRNNAQRFAPLGRLLGITSAELTESGTVIYHKGHTRIAASTSPVAQWIALHNVRVTFALHSTPGHFIERCMFTHTEGINLTDLTNRKNRGLIKDEIDHFELDEGMNPYILSGKDEPFTKVMRRYWRPRTYKQWFATDSTSYDQRLAVAEQRLRQDIASIRTLLPELHTTEDALAVAVLRALFREVQNVPTHDLDTPRVAYFSKDGLLTPAGEYDLLRRFWFHVTDKQYDSKMFIPEEWETFLGDFIPVHIFQSIQAALAVGDNYHVHEGKIVVDSPSTGWPQPGKEYEILTLIALYTKESLKKHSSLHMPSMLHESINAMTPSTVDNLLYSKTIGLTGTAISATEWFRKARGLDVVAIPPQYEDRVDRSHAYIPCPADQKPQRIIEMIKQKSDSRVPFLIDVPTKDVQQQLISLLHDAFPNRPVQTLAATNTEQADQIFQEAGKPDTISVVLLMAGREVDIPVDSQLDDAGGLTIISYEPRKIGRNETQLIGRTGRAGNRGAYHCLVSPDDEVFSYLSTTDRVLLRFWLARGNQQGISRQITLGQRVYENRLTDQNLYGIHIFEPLTDAYRTLFTLPPETRQAIGPIWRDFLTYVQTIGQSAFGGLYWNFQRLPMETRLTVWKNHVSHVFSAVVELAKSSQKDNLPQDIQLYLETASDQLTQL